MGKNRIFFPQEALHAWLVEGRVDLTNDELTIKTEGRRYRLAEAARVVREVTSAPDAFELVGKVKSLGFLRELGAELLDRSMIIGENAYDIVPGFLGAPVGSFAEHLAGAQAAEAQRSRPEGLRPPSTDEELLGQFLLRALLCVKGGRRRAKGRPIGARRRAAGRATNWRVLSGPCPRPTKRPRRPGRGARRAAGSSGRRGLGRPRRAIRRPNVSGSWGPSGPARARRNTSARPLTGGESPT
jgi:hypothetical protein